MMRTVTLLMGALLFLCNAALPQDVFKLIGADKTFHIDFPSEPQHDHQSSEANGIHVESHSYSSETSGSKFILTFVDIRPSPPKTFNADAALDAAIGGTVQNVGGHLASQHSTTFQNYPAKSATIGVGSDTLDGLFVSVHGRTYQLLVLHHGTAKPVFEERFFNSFKIDLPTFKADRQ